MVQQRVANLKSFVDLEYESMTQQMTVVLGPGQGAQAVGMGKAWAAASPAAKAIFDQADAVLGDRLGATLSQLCFEGPAEQLNQTNVSQPAIYTCSVASHAGIVEAAGEVGASAAAGLSLGEYTALHLAGVFDFETGLELVARRGRLMQDGAESSSGSMVALMGADESEAVELCKDVLATLDEAAVLVPANFNAPGQIVLSGSTSACAAAVVAAEERGWRGKQLTVAGAFHSALMAPAAEAMKTYLDDVDFRTPSMPVWSNVTAKPHFTNDLEQMKQSLVEQITHPVRWSQSCMGMIEAGAREFLELAPGKVLKGLMRRVDRDVKVTTHDEPSQASTH